MKSKIILSALLTAVMTFSTVTPAAAMAVSVERAVPVAEGKASAEINEKNMETALLAAKKLIKIDTDELTEFQYSFYDYKSNDTGEYTGTWNFSWFSEDYSKSVYANVLDNGFVMNFSIYTSNSDYTQKLKNITRAQAEKTAEELIKTIMPDSASYYKCKSYSAYLTSNTITLTYYAEINGYTFYLPVSISVDKFTGEITGMSRDITQIKDYNFVSPEKVISQADALKAYNEKLGLELIYNYYYDYNKREIKVYPAYQVKGYGKYIDALTGEVISVSADNYIAYASAAPVDVKEESVMGDRGGFSPAETAALESVKNSITSEQAIKITKDLLSADGEIGDVEANASLSKHYINKDQYLWNVYIYSADKDFSANASVDAVTGKIVSYYSYNYEKQDKKAEQLSEEKLKAKALDIIANLSSANLKDYIDRTDYESLKDNTIYSLSFCKKVNGIPYIGSSISISLDAFTGKLRSYSNNDYICETFPDISTVKSTKDVLAIISESIPYEVTYKATGYNEKTKKYDTALVYEFKSMLSQIDPFTGNFLSYDGTVNETEIGEPDYSDITDDYLKKAVEALTDNGVKLWNGKFLASKEMTEKEFYSIASSFFYSNAVRYYSDVKNEESLSDSPIKRKEAFKLVCELLGYGDLAKNHKLFVNPFGNSIDLEYRGYVAVCNSLNMIRPDNPNNMYNANANLTRADFVYMLYGYIKNN